MGTKTTLRTTMLGLLLAALASTAAVAQQLDQNFEEWIPGPQSELDSADRIISGWSSDSYYGLERSADARSGAWAAIVHNWYSYVPGALSLGNASVGRLGRNLVETGVQIDQAPARLSGYYKYSLGSVREPDSAMVMIMLKSYDPARDAYDTLSFVTSRLAEADAYTPFSIPIPAPRASAGPMELAVAFLSSRQGLCIGPGTCCFLYLDDLTFSTAAGVPMPVDGRLLPEVVVAPNPVSDRLSLTFDGRSGERYVARVLDLSGAEVRRHEFTGAHLDVATSGLARGAYVVMVRDADGRGVARGRFVVE